MLLTALDHRAATYEKLEQLKLALRDSREMIELKPEFAKVSFRSRLLHLQRLTICLGILAMCKSLAAHGK